MFVLCPPDGCLCVFWKCEDFYMGSARDSIGKISYQLLSKSSLSNRAQSIRIRCSFCLALWMRLRLIPDQFEFIWIFLNECARDIHIVISFLNVHVLYVSSNSIARFILAVFFLMFLWFYLNFDLARFAITYLVDLVVPMRSLWYDSN